jgi:predicted lipoprotein with Yx(FWY)xxD motif
VGKRTAPVLLLAAVLCGCGDASAHRSPAHPAGPPKSVRVEHTRLGAILADSRGRTLYLFTNDRRGRSRCYRACARVWHPATVRGRPTAGPGLTARLTTVRRRDHGRQLVYNGHPLYTLTADTRPGQINGQGFSGSWFVLSPSGRMIGRPRRKPGY